MVYASSAAIGPAQRPGEVDALADRLVAAREPLRRMPLAARIEAIDRASAGWLMPDSPWRREAVATLPASTGYPARTITTALDNLARALAASELHAVARAEQAALAAPAPQLALHVLAGNVPGAGVFGIVAALLAGVPSLVKTTRREPLLPPLFARSLDAEDERLGAALAVVDSDDGDHAGTARAIERADVVLAYGRAESLDAIAAHRPRRLLRFGPRLSIAVITRDAVGRRAAADLAWETALFDQQGCLSPQLVVLEETSRSATARFIDALADELARLAVDMPRAPLAIAEAAVVARYLERQRWRIQEGADMAMVGDVDGRFSVVCDRTGSPLASPLNRHLIVVPAPALADARTVLARFDGVVEAVGFSGPSRRTRDVAAFAAACSASRLCPLERMQAPPFAWRQSGHARLACFVASP
jgi:acyl-CoA reductase-like NAD-dependent aldehyde dehydrogenase